MIAQQFKESSCFRDFVIISSSFSISITDVIAFRISFCRFISVLTLLMRLYAASSLIFWMPSSSFARFTFSWCSFNSSLISFTLSTMRHCANSFLSSFPSSSIPRLQIKTPRIIAHATRIKESNTFIRSAFLNRMLTIRIIIPGTLQIPTVSALVMLSP